MEKQGIKMLKDQKRSTKRIEFAAVLRDKIAEVEQIREELLRRGKTEGSTESTQSKLKPTTSNAQEKSSISSQPLSFDSKSNEGQI
mmetsp:Transcript_19492/g.33132  ORF Transcript_19492/g.33132 Transcript_19492/m.33132 type:complete len:86 (-) Transcript_19492:83-340(-)